MSSIVCRRSLRIEGGHFGDVRLNDLNFLMLANWPAANHEGNGEALMLVDERADEGRGVIERFLRGEIGRPWAILVDTFTTILGPAIVPYDVELAGDRIRIQAGNTLKLATEPIRDPAMQANVHPRAVLPEGFIFKDGAMLSSAAFRVKGEVTYGHSGQYAAIGPFDYRAP